ncbi:MAG: hypothetical protein F6K16_37625 [Symploca sp. SIO2B6]|nr:hypothetical protein [Symploca sp. SIO2B6]
MSANVGNTTNWIEAGHRFRQDGDLDSAISCYQKFSDKNPFLANLWIGISLAQKEQYDLAVSTLNDTLLSLSIHDRRRATLYYHLGMICQKRGWLKEALVKYEEALYIDDRLVLVRQEMALVLDRLGYIDEAIRIQKQAHTLSSNEAGINFYTENLTLKKKNLEFSEKYKYRIISLGEDCLPRVIFTRWGLKRTRAQGELSCPFDLAVHPYPSVCKLIENNFQNYLDRNKLEKQENHRAHFGIPLVINKALGCVFNHERGNKWTENDFSYFIERYRKRISNFYQYISTEHILFFIHDRKGIYDGRLQSILENLFDQEKFQLLVLNTSGKLYPEHLIFKNEVILNMNFPSDDYQWSLIKFYSSPLGKAFELRIIESTKEIISSGFPLLGRYRSLTSRVVSGSPFECIAEPESLSSNNLNIDAIRKQTSPYQRIWEDFNKVDPSLYPIYLSEPERDFKLVEDFFVQESRYIFINLSQVEPEKQKYIEQVGLSLEYLRVNADDITIDGASERGDSNESPLGFDPFHWHDAEQKTIFQLSVFQSGWIYAICPWTGKVLASNTSFYAWHWTRGGMIFYRFVGEEVFYLIVGGPWGQKCSLYFPRTELIIHITPYFDFFPDAKVINGWKADIVKNWRYVRGYLERSGHRKLAVLIGQNKNIGHYVSNILSGIQKGYEHCGFDTVDCFFIIGPEFYGPTEGIFPEVKSHKIERFQQLHLVSRKLLEQNYFGIRLGDVFIKETLASRIYQYAEGKCEAEVSRHVQLVKETCSPIIWITLRTGSRSWVNQSEGITKILSRLSENFPKMGVIFNGFSCSELRNEYDKQKENDLINREKQEILKINQCLSPDLATYDIVGKMMHECILWAYIADVFLGPWGATLTNALIANKPGVVHTNNAVLNMPLKRRWGSWEREGGSIPIYVPREYIFEKENSANNKSNPWDDRPTLKNYDCDWEVIYQLLLQLISKSRKIRGLN